MSPAQRFLPVLASLALLSTTTWVLGGLARAETTALAPREDLFVSEALGTRDTADLRQLRVDGAPRKVAYLTFDVPEGGAGGARLEIYAYNHNEGVDVSVGASPEVAAEVPSPGQSSPAGPTAPLDPTPGSASDEPSGDIASPLPSETQDARTPGISPAGDGAPTASTGPIPGGGWVTIDVSNLVRAGATTTLALTTTSAQGAVFSSMEGAFAPQLVLGSAGAPLPTETPTATPSEKPAPTPTESSEPAPSPSATAPHVPGSGVASWEVETPPVRGSGDVADDPAIWVNPSDASQSLVIGANKDNSTGGLHVYDLAGNELQYVGSGKMNNVDVRNGITFGGSPADIIAATNRTKDTIDFFRVASQRLEPVGSVEAGISVYGSCMYLSSAGELFAFANSEAGEVEQYRVDTSGSSVTATLVRAFDVGSATEGCVADDDSGDLYIAEERVGIWKYGAQPDAGTTRTQVDSVNSGHLTPDVEGLTIYYGPNGGGYLIASSQGDSSFALYARADNAYIGSFEITGSGDDVTETDGIDVTSTPLGGFTEGLLVVHDASNEGTSNFKYVPWSQAAAALGLGGAPGAPTPTPSVTTTPGPVPSPPEPPAHVSTKVMTCQSLDGTC